ncbi:MAG: SEC-C metal-binding domain-containing protein [Planctomycetota bacterium]
MTVDELIDAIVSAGLDVPEGLPEEIVKRGSAAVPRLCEIVRSEEWWAKEEYPQTWAVIHAMHLLGSIGDPSAIDALLEPMRRDEDTDFICNDMMGVIARLGPTAFEAVAEFVRDPSHSSSYRWCAYHGLVGMAELSPAVKERVIGLGREVVERALAGGELCPEGVAGLLAGYRQEEDPSLLKRLYDEDRVEDTFIYGWEGIEDTMQNGLGENDRFFATKDPMSFYAKKNLERIEEINAESDSDEYEDWEDDDFGPEWAEDESPFESERGGYEHPYLVTPPIFSEERVGRNDPCPCGSGKKYKKCCGKT